MNRELGMVNGELGGAGRRQAAGASASTLVEVPAVELVEGVKDFRIGVRGVRLRAVDHLSLRVRRGEVFGLLGPNGSGKSTTIKAVLGLLKLTEGECRVFGVEAGKVEARKRVGYLPEAPNFYRFLSGRELVEFYGKVCGLRGDLLRRKVGEVLEWVGLESEAAGRRVGTYSKGMLQRVGLAGALVHDPELLILDEPTAGVDPVGAAEMLGLVKRLKREGKTVVVTSHLLGQMEEVCDAVAILDRGRLVVEGRMEELLGGEGQVVRVEGGAFSEGELEELRSLEEKWGRRVVEAGRARRGLEEIFLGAVMKGRKE